MPTINEANRQQIRPPMDVMVTLQVGDDVALTYSGYSDAKLADGRLNEPNEKMAKLTDLQGDGYPLDYTCSMLNPSSLYHSKWGVRSNIGESVNVTITADGSIGYVSAWADGCESVTFNGDDYPMIAGTVNIYIEDSSATFTFNPLYEDRRIEVSLLASGSYYIFNNESIISCVVSLRSDLSLINPTLPESEIELQVYQDEDISESLASIPDETTITYSSGYPEEMSPLRYFYLSEKITWADNVMTIHAVDAVHKLDIPLPTATLLTGDEWRVTSGTNEISIYSFLSRCLYYAGVDYNSSTPDETAGTTKSSLIFERTSIREAIAKAMTWGRFGNYTHNCWFNYVDAGNPYLTYSYQNEEWDIYESDCGDVKRETARNIKEIQMPVSSLSFANTSNYFATEVGSGTWIYGSGAFLDFDDDVYAWKVKDKQGTDLLSIESDSLSTLAIMPTNALAVYSEHVFGLMEQGLPMGSMNAYYTQVMPWNSNQLSDWNSDVGSSVRDDQNLTIMGSKVQKDTHVQSFSTGRDDGEIIILDEAPIEGKLIVQDPAEPQYVLYPDMAAQSILNMSNVTGSFKWKGHPKMQPRDSAIFHRLDGTTELITIENITLTHEGGGTSAEITYRKGKC